MELDFIFPFARKSAVWALGEIEDSKAIGLLNEISKSDPNSNVRQTAKEALANIRGE